MVTSAGAPVRATTESREIVAPNSSRVISISAAARGEPTRTLATDAEYWSAAPLTGSPYRDQPRRPRSWMQEIPALVMVMCSGMVGLQVASGVGVPVLLADGEELDGVARAVGDEGVATQVQQGQWGLSEDLPPAWRGGRGDDGLSAGHRDHPSRRRGARRHQARDRRGEVGAVHHRRTGGCAQAADGERPCGVQVDHGVGADPQEVRHELEVRTTVTAIDDRNPEVTNGRPGGGPVGDVAGDSGDQIGDAVVVGQYAVELHQDRFVRRDHAVQSGDVGRGEHVGQVLHDLPLRLGVAAGGADPDGRVAALRDNESNEVCCDGCCCRHDRAPAPTGSVARAAAVVSTSRSGAIRTPADCNSARIRWARLMAVGLSPCSSTVSHCTGTTVPSTERISPSTTILTVRCAISCSSCRTAPGSLRGTRVPSARYARSAMPTMPTRMPRDRAASASSPSWASTISPGSTASTASTTAAA